MTGRNFTKADLKALALFARRHCRDLEVPFGHRRTLNALLAVILSRVMPCQALYDRAAAVRDEFVAPYRNSLRFSALIAADELLDAIAGKQLIVLGASLGRPPCLDGRPVQGHVHLGAGLATIPTRPLRDACRADSIAIDVSLDGFAIAVVDARRGRIVKPRLFDFRGRRVRGVSGLLRHPFPGSCDLQS